LPTRRSWPTTRRSAASFATLGAVAARAGSARHLVLIRGGEDPGEDVAISVVSLTELYLGVLVAADEEVRAARLRRLGAIEESLTRCPFEAAAARECGRLYAAVAQRGGQPRGPAFDLAIAATANVHGVPLLTLTADDFKLIDDLVDIRAPSCRSHPGCVALAFPLTEPMSLVLSS
jgi:predicted nucleic acid-binding protein